MKGMHQYKAARAREFRRAASSDSDAVCAGALHSSVRHIISSDHLEVRKHRPPVSILAPVQIANRILDALPGA